MYSMYYDTKHNTDTNINKKNQVINVLILMIGLGLVGNVFSTTIKTTLLVLLGLCAITIIISKQKINLALMDIVWIIAFLFIILNTRTWNRRNIMFSLCLFLGICLFFGIRHYVYQFYESLQIILVIGLIAAASSIFQVVLPTITLRIFARLSSTLYLDAIYSSTIGRFLGVTNYVWNIALFSLIGIGYIITNFKEKIRSTQYLYIIMITILYVPVFLAGSRSSIILLPVCAFIAFLDMRSNKQKIGVVVALIAFYFLYEYLTNYDNSIEASNFRFINQMSRLVNRFIAGETVDATRDMLKKMAAHYFSENPFFGIGWFEFSNQNVGILRANQYSHVHNLYYQLLAENGIFGATLIFAPILWIYIQTALYLNSGVAKLLVHQRETSIIRFGFFFQTYILLASWTHVTFYGTDTIILYLLICGMTIGGIKNVKQKESMKKVELLD